MSLIWFVDNTGSHMNLIDATEEINKLLASITPTETVKERLPTERWISDADLVVDTDEDVTAAGSSSTSTGLSVFSNLNDLIEKTTDMLSTDCNHLLRQAQTSLSKANK